MNRRLFAQGLPLLALWNFGAVQPLFDLIGQNPTFLTAHGLLGGPLVGFTLAVGFLPPILALIIWRLCAPLHRQLYWLPPLLSGLLIVPVVAQLTERWLADVSPVSQLLLMVAVAGLLVWGLRRRAFAISFLQIASIAAIAFPALFLARLPDHYLFQETPTVSAGAGLKARQNELPDVVLIVFDELALTTLLTDSFEIDAARYPGFAALESSSTWYAQASAVAAGTRIALPAILTGHTPNPDLAPDAASHPDNLFTRLSPAYALNIEEPITQLCPAALCRQTVDWSLVAEDTTVLLGHTTRLRALTARLPAVGTQWTGFLRNTSTTHVDERVQSLMRFRKGLSASRGPTLSFLHIVLPHIPYTILPSGERLFRHGALSGHAIDDRGDRFIDTPWSTVEARALYEWQLRYVDSALEQIIKTLKETGRFENALLIVTADHGVRFTAAKSRREPTPESYIDIASIPLLVKRPGQIERQRSASPIQSTDIRTLIERELGTDSDNAPNPWDKREKREILSSSGWVSLPTRFDFNQRENVSRAALEAGLAPSVASRTVADLQVCLESDAITLLQHPLYANTHPEHFLPAHIVFEVPGEAMEPTEKLTLLFNGSPFVIQKTGTTRFSAFVDPDLFNAGFNAVQLVRLNGAEQCILYDNQSSD